MRILLLAIGAIAILAAVYALNTTVGMKEGTRASGLVATFALAAVATLAIGLYGVLCEIEQLRNELDAVRAATAKSEPAASVAATPVATPSATTVDDLEAAALMKTAEDHHFAKDFAAALAVYREVVARFGDSKQAAKARQQIANLESIA